MKKLLIGLGNPYCGDDAIGIIVAEQLKDRHHDWNVIAGALDGFNFIETIDGYDSVLILDALIAGDAVVGELYEIKLGDFKGLSNPSYLHSMSLDAALDMGKRLGIKMPGTLKVIGIGIKSKCDFGDKMDPALESKIDAIVEKIENCLQ
ncbi:MAG TPA: hydrogenase maturation protease [bacterium]